MLTEVTATSLHNDNGLYINCHFGGKEWPGHQVWWYPSSSRESRLPWICSRLSTGLCTPPCRDGVYGSIVMWGESKCVIQRRKEDLKSLWLFLVQSGEAPELVSIIGESQDETQVGWSVCILAHSGSNLDSGHWCVQFNPKPRPRTRRRNKQRPRPIPGSRPRPWLDSNVPFRF